MLIINLFHANTPFLYTLKMSKTRSFMTFSGGKKIEYCRKMDYQKPLNSKSVVTFSY